jgi:hypothetical protein
MSWTPIGIDGVFFLSLATILAGSFGVAIKYCLKSKCEHFSLFCGLVSIDRRVDLEVQEEIKAMELGVKEDEEKKEEKDNKV